MSPHNNEHDQYAEHFDAGHSGKEHTVHQRLRANSTIMELKKILGAHFLGDILLACRGGAIRDAIANHGFFEHFSG